MTSTVTTSAPRLICVAPNPSIDKTAEVERLEPGTIHRPLALLAVPGGKGLNVARAAQRLGLPVDAIALLAGHAGRWIDDELERIGIPRRVVWSTGETRSCLSVLDRSTGALTEFYESGPGPSPRVWRRFVQVARAACAGAPAGSIVALSGSLPPGAPAGGAAELVVAGQDAGCRVIVDTAGLPLERALAARPFVVKINAQEAETVTGLLIRDEAGAIAAAQDLVRKGAAQAIVTRGVRGAVAWDGAQAWAVEPSGAGGPYAVGSGDAFLAGVAAGLMAGASLADSLVRGTGAAVANTEIIGAGELRRAAARRHAAGAAIRRVD